MCIYKVYILKAFNYFPLFLKTIVNDTSVSCNIHLK